MPKLKKLAQHTFESAAAQSGVRYRMKDGYAAFRAAFPAPEQCWWPAAAQTREADQEDRAAAPAAAEA